MADTFKPKISVIVPVLNNVTTLQECLDSILIQDTHDLEIIVIDGGSTDGTLEVIQNNSSHITYWETGLDSGISDAFNRGIQQANGGVIAILNSDDFWEPNTAQQVISTASLHPEVDIFYGQVRYLDQTTSNTYIKHPNLYRMHQRMYLFHPAVFIKQSAYKKIGAYSETYKLAMDSEWLHRAIASDLKFKAIDSVLANMRLCGRSDQQFVSALNEYRKSLLEHDLSSQFFANYYFIKYVILKSIMRFTLLRRIKQKIAS
jgi:glycosyltransferase involved in cell wall biosynthesis